jgi:hypothetical protein
LSLLQFLPQVATLKSQVLDLKVFPVTVSLNLIDNPALLIQMILSLLDLLLLLQNDRILHFNFLLVGLLLGLNLLNGL